MDLQLFVRVLSRFKVLAVVGFVLATLFAVLAFAQVDFKDGPTLRYRDTEKWESLSTVFVTSEGFPWGSIAFESTDKTAPIDTGRLTGLTDIYMQLAASDEVRKLMLRNGPIDGVLGAFPVYGGSQAQLPLMTLSAIAATPPEAYRLNVRYLSALLTYLRRQQVVGDIDPKDRVRFEVVSEPQPAKLVQGRSKNLPIVVFMGVMCAFVGLAFVLENLRPRPRPIAPEAVPDPMVLASDPLPRTAPHEANRRSA